MKKTFDRKKLLDEIRPLSHKALKKKYGMDYYRKLALKRWDAKKNENL